MIRPCRNTGFTILQDLSKELNDCSNVSCMANPASFANVGYGTGLLTASVSPTQFIAGGPPCLCGLGVCMERSVGG